MLPMKIDVPADTCDLNTVLPFVILKSHHNTEPIYKQIPQQSQDLWNGSLQRKPGGLFPTTAVCKGRKNPKLVPG